MGSLTGEGYYFETSLRAGTFLIDWFTHQVCQSTAGSAALLNELEAEAAAIPIGSDGVLALPYWGAVMTPYWDPLARGCWIGLSGSHRRGHLYRSLLEGHRAGAGAGDGDDRGGDRRAGERSTSPSAEGRRAICGVRSWPTPRASRSGDPGRWRRRAWARRSARRWERGFMRAQPKRRTRCATRSSGRRGPFRKTAPGTPS